MPEYSIKELEALGVKADTGGFDYRKVFRKSRKASDMLSKGISYLLKKNKIELIAGTGVLRGPHEVLVDGDKTVTGDSIIIATGSRPREIPGFPFDEEKVLSSNGALMLEELPKSIIILGGGFIGVEFAHIMNSFGVEVHIVELLDRLLPIEDEESAEVLTRAFKKRGMKILTSTKASGLQTNKKGVVLTVEQNGEKKQLEAEKLLVVVGRQTNTENIGLEEAGIKTERGFIITGDYYQTDVPSVYAIGDVVATPQLAHVASKEGEIVIEHIAGRDTVPRVDVHDVPSAVYCEPQVASIGYREHEAKKEGISYKKAVFPYRGAGKSVSVERSEGFVKVLYDPETSEILGAHIAGLDATELIHEILLAKTSELLPANIAEMIHAHPTLSEAVMEAMRAAEGWAIHV